MLAAMRDAAAATILVLNALADRQLSRADRSDPHCPPAQRQGPNMERTDWLDVGLDSAAARFLMMTAITHHEFSSPNWGNHEIRKLHDELAELDLLAAQMVVDHAESGSPGTSGQ